MPSRDEATFEAFISYSSADSRWARWLQRAIESYRLPRQLRRQLDGRSRVGRVFLDRAELASAPRLGEAIQSALRRSANLIVICSPHAVASRWVNEEIKYFDSLGRGDRIFSVIVDGNPASSTPDTAAFPPALRALKSTEADEPLGADVRPARDGRTGAKLKTIAGLLDVAYDALRQRDAARANRRLSLIAASSFTLMLIMLVLTTVAIRSRNEARRQTATALRTTDFMRSLFRVSDPYETQGTTITARQMVDRGVRQLVEGRDLADQPAVRADLLTTLAEAYDSLGLISDTRRLVAYTTKEPIADQMTRARLLAVDAEIASRQHELDHARRGFLEALQLAGETPSRVRSEALLGLGLTETASGRYAEADRVLTMARKSSLAEQPINRDVDAEALLALGLNSYAAGHLHDAAQRLRTAMVRRRSISGPTHSDIATGYATLGVIASRSGDRLQAERQFRLALALQTKLLGPDHPQVLIIKGNLARVLTEGSRFAEAQALVTPAIAGLAARGAGQFYAVGNMYDTAGLAAAGLGQTAAARSAYAHALAVVAGQGDPKEGDVHVDLAETACRAGRTDEGLASLDAAERAYRAAGDSKRLASRPALGGPRRLPVAGGGRLFRARAARHVAARRPDAVGCRQHLRAELARRSPKRRRGLRRDRIPMMPQGGEARIGTKRRERERTLI